MSGVALNDPQALAADCRRGAVSPSAVVAEVVERSAASRRPEAWLFRLPPAALEQRAAQLEECSAVQRESLPLFGVPIAIKDNIDIAGVPTTAGCPAFSYVPQRHATVVAQLIAAGAIIVGKTHMDQFATGLVGTRNPYGPCRNAYHPAYISGGSSSGSAVVVAEGEVSLALGTDTAGSGRVPAVLNGVIGLKPTRGLLSLNGVVPACSSLDCVSVFAPDIGGARLALDVLVQSPADHFQSRARAEWLPVEQQFRFGVPGETQLEGLDDEALRLYGETVARLEAIGGERVAIDYAPFLATSRLLYAGPWVAERDAAVGDFIAAHPEAVDPAVMKIISASRGVSARAAFEGSYELRRLQSQIAPLWETIDCLVVPTVGRAVLIEESLREPLAISVMLGLHNNFMNLLDLSGCAVPTGSWRCGVPFGVTLCAPAFAEYRLLDIAQRLPAPQSAAPTKAGRIPFVVVGAHLRGMPLNASLVNDGGRFESAVRTSADYRLYALRGTVPPKPGLARVVAGGASIEAEVWSLPADAFGRFVAAIPRPLGMGHVTLADGRELAGFICEPAGLLDAEDVTSYGGWRAYIAAR